MVCYLSNAKHFNEARSNHFSEMDWKFVDQAAFKAIPTDTQKSILLNTLTNNITQFILGAQDSYVLETQAS